MTCADNVTKLEETDFEDFNNKIDIILGFTIPPAIIGVSLNTLCLVYFLRHQRKGLGDQMVIGLCIADTLQCFASCFLFAVEWRPSTALIAAKAVEGFSGILTTLCGQKYLT